MKTKSLSGLANTSPLFPLASLNKIPELLFSDVGSPVKRAISLPKFVA
jgi:hypothetical protein